MGVKLPLYTDVSVSEFQMYPGTSEVAGIQHKFCPGLHLIAGVNGLGKSTLLLVLYHGLVGPAAIKNDDFGVSLPDIAPRRDAAKFRRRVADGAKDADACVTFEIGKETFEVTRSLYDLSLVDWKIDGTSQPLDDEIYMGEIARAMDVGSFADVLIILNLLVFMFEDRELLMWSPLAQRNALRALFMAPDDANELAKKAQSVATANSAYRNLNYIVNRDRKKLHKAKEQLLAADALSAEYHTLQSGIAALNEKLETLNLRRQETEQQLGEARAATEAAKFGYDGYIREIEALKLSRVAGAFPTADQSSHYVLTRLIGDRECLACGAEDGPLIDKWIATIASGECLVCGSEPSDQETIVPSEVVDTARITKLEQRLKKSREALETAEQDQGALGQARAKIQAEIDEIVRERDPLESRAREIAGFVPPSPPEVAALEEKLSSDEETLAGLKDEQAQAESEFSAIFSGFRSSVDSKADAIRAKFGEKIAEFLVEAAEISLATKRGPIGESGQSYDWPTFNLSMTSGTFSAPAPRLSRSEVSMSQGEFIDLAFRLALVNVAAEDGPATMIFDAPEASLDALFMRRAGAFLSRFTSENEFNRLIVTSNLTNTDMIPALFGAYEPQEGDPVPTPIPRDERRGRVINLLKIAAPTSAVELVGDRYNDILEEALFPVSSDASVGL